MDEAALLKRKADFEEGLKKAQETIAQLQANIQATLGAIQEIDYWIAQMETKEKK